MKGTPRSARAFFRDPARRPLAGIAVGASALALGFGFGGSGFSASYLPAWLCLFALPAGALPVAIMFERADAWRPQPETALLETLRGLLTLMPVAGLLLVPVLFCLPALYPWARGEPQGATLAAFWYTVPFLLARLALCFAAWTGLAVLFTRRGGAPWGKAGRSDDGRAVLGLGLHLLLGTLVANDLVMAVSAPFAPALSDLLLIASWSSLALSAGIVVAPPDIGPTRRRLDRLTPLAVLLAIWAFLHLTLSLFALAGDLPGSEQWYGARTGGEGTALIVYAALVVLVAAATTLRRGEYKTRLAAAAALAAHVLETAWFVTPSLRGSFKLTLLDLVAFIGLAGLALGLLPLTRRLFPDVAPLRLAPASAPFAHEGDGSRAVVRDRQRS